MNDNNFYKNNYNVIMAYLNRYEISLNKFLSYNNKDRLFLINLLIQANNYKKGGRL